MGVSTFSLVALIIRSFIDISFGDSLEHHMYDANVLPTPNDYNFLAFLPLHLLIERKLLIAFRRLVFRSEASYAQKTIWHTNVQVYFPHTIR